jgi:hypothetical protein
VVVVVIVGVAVVRQSCPHKRHADIYIWSRVQVALILSIGTSGSELSTSRSGRFTPGKETQNALNRRLVGPQNRCELCF